MIKSDWILEDLVNLRLDNCPYETYESNHPFVAKLLLVPFEDPTRGMDKTLYGGHISNDDPIFKKYGLTIRNLIVEGDWDYDNPEHRKLHDKNAIGMDIACIYHYDKPVILLIDDKHDRSNPDMYVLDRDKYYLIRSIIASMVETWNADKMCIDDYLTGINEIVSIKKLFEYAYEEYICMDQYFVVQDNKLQIVDTESDTVELSYRDICNLQYQSILYDTIPFRIAESISAVFNKTYSINKYSQSRERTETEEYKKYGETGFPVEGYKVYQYIHHVSKYTYPDTDYLYVVKTTDEVPVMLLSSGQEWYDIHIFDKDLFMSLWAEVLYYAGKYKLLPDSMLVSNRMVIDLSYYLPLDNLEFKDNQIVNVIVPE